MREGSNRLRDNKVNSLEKKSEISNQIARREDINLSTTWMSNTIDWEYSFNLSLMSISSYVGYETGNISGPSRMIKLCRVRSFGQTNQ